MFHIQLRSGVFPGSLKTSKYESMSILLLAKANISFTRKPTKCGTCMLLSWEFFRYYINQISASANHLFFCKYFLIYFLFVWAIGGRNMSASSCSSLNTSFLVLALIDICLILIFAFSIQFLLFNDFQHFVLSR